MTTRNQRIQRKRDTARGSLTKLIPKVTGVNRQQFNSLSLGIKGVGIVDLIHGQKQIFVTSALGYDRQGDRHIATSEELDLIIAYMEKVEADKAKGEGTT